MIRLKTLLEQSAQSKFKINYDLDTIEINGVHFVGRTVDSPSTWDRWTYFIGNNGNYYTKLKSSTSGWKNLNTLPAVKFAAAKKLIDTFETATNTEDTDIPGLSIKSIRIDTAASRASSTNTTIKVKGYLTAVDANGKRVYPNQAQLQKLFGNDTIITCEEAYNVEIVGQTKPLTSLNFEMDLAKKLTSDPAYVPGHINLRFELDNLENPNLDLKSELWYPGTNGNNRYAAISYDDIKRK